MRREPNFLNTGQPDDDTNKNEIQSNMKKPTHPHLVTLSGLALALAVVITTPARAQPAEPMKGKMMMEGMKMDGKMMKSCQTMMEQKQKLQADMKAQDAELTEHVAKMNGAPEAEKPGIMAAVITHMLEQRIAMDARKSKMQEEMMQHMMQHMQMGAASMSQCPMMKGMGDNPAVARQEHQAEPK